MPQAANSANQKTSNDGQLLSQRASQVQGGAARAAVLGVNDGLVSVLSIILGVAGAKANAHTVLLAGFAGLIAGAFSMAAGEWISVTSQVELFQGVLKDVKKLLKNDRAILEEQLQSDYVNDGLNKATAAKAVAEIAQSDDNLFSEYTENVIGINPDELGSPWSAAISSFALFTAGALAALAPWFFTHGTLAIILTVVFTAIGGLLVGAYIARSSGNSVVKGSLRQLLIIILAAAITYGIGHVFGAVTS